MTQELKLTIELVPETTWFISMYNYYKKNNKMNKWQELKENLFEKEGKKCWICSKDNLRLEAHEFWEYDDKSKIQKLIAIHHLCSLCHKVKHIGFWLNTSEGLKKLKEEELKKEDVVNHFCNVNNCSAEEFNKHSKDAFRLFQERSRHEWIQDLGGYKI